MRKVLKRVGIIVASLLGIIVLLALVLFGLGRSTITRTHAVPTLAFAIPNDADALARGKHIVTAVSGCADCHGANLAGTVFIDDPPLGQVVASNLTPGVGGIGSSYTDADWVNVLRYGIKPNGHSLLPMMPVEHYTHMDDEDLAAVVAYLTTLPPVDHQLPTTTLLAPGTIILGVLAADQLPATAIDPTMARATVPAAISPEYGHYLVELGACAACHSTTLAGGRIDPSEPWAPNITPGGALQGWTEADFATLVRTGQAPGGRQIDPFMPWSTYQHMTDDEIAAVWSYLQSLEPLPSNTP